MSLFGGMFWAPFPLVQNLSNVPYYGCLNFMDPLNSNIICRCPLMAFMFEEGNIDWILLETERNQHFVTVHCAKAKPWAKLRLKLVEKMSQPRKSKCGSGCGIVEIFVFINYLGKYARMHFRRENPSIFSSSQNDHIFKICRLETYRIAKISTKISGFSKKLS